MVGKLGQDTGQASCVGQAEGRGSVLGEKRKISLRIKGKDA